jgi:uncharacterized protein (DUF305 family)
MFPNLNQLYMAGMMTAPMILFELVLMRAMYPNKKINTAVVIGSAALGILCITGIRTQAVVGDTQLVKSMIPHHAAAILMCEEALLHDVETRALCQSIIQSQQAEIDWMRAKLQEN